MKKLFKSLLPTSGSRLQPSMTKGAKRARFILFLVLLCSMVWYAWYVKGSPLMVLIILLGFGVAFVSSFNKGYFLFSRKR